MFWKTGSHFRIPIISNLSHEEIDYQLPENTILLYAETENKNTQNTLKTIDYAKFSQTYVGIPHVTLVIGNESTGIDPKISKITKISKNNQAYIHVPLANQVESLNCTLAFGVLGFEIRKIFQQ